VIAFSSGNHAQAIALSARLLGMPSVIVMPQDAPAAKVAATRGYQAGQPGSEVVLYDRYTEDREAIGRRLAQERGMTLIPPYDHPHVMAGQGTAALELIEDTAAGGPLDALLVCVGGGGLISAARWRRTQLNPDIQVWGVEPEAGNDTQQSLAQGKIVHIDTPQTIADGAQTQHSGELTFPVIQQLVRGIVTVSDAQLVEAMRFFAERMKIVVEPTGALGAAALFSQATGLPDLRGRRVGVILSGGKRAASTAGRLIPHPPRGLPLPRRQGNRRVVPPPPRHGVRAGDRRGPGAVHARARPLHAPVHGRRRRQHPGLLRAAVFARDGA
jgi:threo-3-hydroxy-L-aspartate ammonia-lyase